MSSPGTAPCARTRRHWLRKPQPASTKSCQLHIVRSILCPRGQPRRTQSPTCPPDPAVVRGSQGVSVGRAVRRVARKLASQTLKSRSMRSLRTRTDAASSITSFSSFSSSVCTLSSISGIDNRGEKRTLYASGRPSRSRGGAPLRPCALADFLSNFSWFWAPALRQVSRAVSSTREKWWL